MAADGGLAAADLASEQTDAAQFGVLGAGEGAERTDARSVVEEADEVALAPPFAVGDNTASLSRRCPQALISARQPVNRCGNMPFTSLRTCCTRRTRRRTQRIAPGSSTASRRN